ncbi:MAG: hypothetical protein P8R54_08220 [Myxococcota bacterium]|nr:hypothetical protein [Myxococcota bacterium]
MPPLPAFWPHLRALLVTAHIIAVFAVAFPSPTGGMNRSTWKNPTVQAEMAAWGARLSIPPDELEANLWTLAKTFMEGRKVVLAPFQPYYSHAGTHQAWHMFVAPHRNPARLHIDIDRGEDWETIYISRDPTLTWKAPLLDHNRARAALFRYSWRHYRGSFRKLGQWLASEAASDFPRADRMRLRWYRYQTPTPRQVADNTIPAGHFESARIHNLAALR